MQLELEEAFVLLFCGPNGDLHACSRYEVKALFWKKNFIKHKTLNLCVHV